MWSTRTSERLGPDSSAPDLQLRHGGRVVRLLRDHSFSFGLWDALWDPRAAALLGVYRSRDLQRPSRSLRCALWDQRDLLAATVIVLSAVTALAAAPDAPSSGVSSLLIAMLLAFVGGSAFAGIVAGLFARRLTRAQSRSTDADARHKDSVTVGQWIDNNERQARRIGELETRHIELNTKLNNMGDRVEQLVERERHALARAAAHSVWDELVLRKLADAGNLDIPQPPPLFVRGELEGVDDDEYHDG